MRHLPPLPRPPRALVRFRPRTGELPVILPPGTVVSAIGPEAVTQRMASLADQAHALTSDALDGRDGVDASDAEPIEEPRRRSARRDHARPASPRGRH